MFEALGSLSHPHFLTYSPTTADAVSLLLPLPLLLLLLRAHDGDMQLPNSDQKLSAASAASLSAGGARR